jgi:hypothetical protein
MDYQFEREWLDTLRRIQERFDMGQPDITAIIFLVGLQELQLFDQNFKKDQKVEIMHIGICSLLAPMGYYIFMGRDDQGWPHFEKQEDLPMLSPAEQDRLMREAIIKYFEE